MQREILFRGLRSDNGEWVEGNLFVPDKLLAGVYICPTTTMFDFAPNFEAGQDFETASKDGCSIGLFVEVKPETVGQYTGLMDNEGKKIFEGDVLRNVHSTWENADDPTEETVNMGTVSFEDGTFTCDGYYGDELRDFTIIGNAHSNPELLNP